MDLITTLRNVLLVSLLAMLAYVLYKRMLHIMRRQHTMQKFPSLPNQLYWTDSGKGIIAVSLQQEMHLTVQIFNSEGTLVKEIATGNFPKGDHIFEFFKADLSSGKYYYKVVSPHEDASQYFTIE
jgi:hypothetical protein